MCHQGCDRTFKIPGQPYKNNDEDRNPKANHCNTSCTKNKHAEKRISRTEKNQRQKIESKGQNKSNSTAQTKETTKPHIE